MSTLHEEWQELSLPLWLPELVVTPDAMQIFMFSAVTWNRHHVHYSRDAAVREGLPDVVVQRALIGNYFARLLWRWGGPQVLVSELRWKVLRSAVPGRPLKVQGVVRERDLHAGALHLHCDLSMLDDTGQTVATGSAVLALAQSMKQPPMEQAA
jgi:hypothetical protein